MTEQPQPAIANPSTQHSLATGPSPTAFTHDRMKIVLVTDRRLAGSPAKLLAAAEAALAGGATAIMLREKDLEARDLLAIAQPLRMLTAARRASLIINDRFDVALAVSADGVHLGWKSLPVAEVRRIVHARGIKDFAIGYSAHNLDEARRALADGADYLTVSPIFPTPSKEGIVATVGIAGLREIARAAFEKDFRAVIALGGIDAHNAFECCEAGACGVAVIRALLAAETPVQTEENARKLRDALAGKPQPGTASATLPIV